MDDPLKPGRVRRGYVIRRMRTCPVVITLKAPTSSPARSRITSETTSALDVVAKPDSRNRITPESIKRRRNTSSPKSFVGRYQKGIATVGPAEHLLIRNAGRQLGDIDNVMAILSQSLNYCYVDILIRHQVHSDFAPTGCTTSARRVWAANRRAARTPSRVRRG